MIDYGIQTEQSHYRAHVCPVVKKVYVYQTASGIKAIESGKYTPKMGYQKGVEKATASGYPVPPYDIEGCIGIMLHDGFWDLIGFSETDTTSEKGRKASRLVMLMIEKGLFPFQAVPYNVTNRRAQMSGADIVASIVGGDYVIQVKCDWKGGERALGGTGNLFLQVAEANPMGAH